MDDALPTGRALSPQASGEERADLDDLRRRLAAVAGDEVEVAFRVVELSVGRLFVAATRGGVLRITFLFGDAPDAVVADTAARVSPRILEGGPRLDPVLSQLEEYLAGTRREFDLALDLQLTTPFRRRVVSHLPTISYGHTASYGEVAAALDNPGSTRAVGTACATNPIPLVLPCHRVVRADGSVGQYAGGAEVKHALLAFESGQAPLA